MSSKDNDEERVMHLKSHSIEIMINNKADYWKTFSITSFQVLNASTGMEISMKGSNFIFGCVHLLHYKCHKGNFKHLGSYMKTKTKT